MNAMNQDRSTLLYAKLTFITPQTGKPVFRSQALTGGAPEFTFDVEDHVVPVEDMRPLADELSLDRQGYLLRHAPTSVEDLYDDQAVAGPYFDEVQALLVAEFDASQVEIFDATRRSDSDAGAANPDGTRGPASRIHVDYTAKSGPQRAKDVLGENEYDRLVAGGARILQVNLWRPITGPVARSPLALADADTIANKDLVATDQIFPDRVGEIYHLTFNSGQRWRYAPDMTRDEVLLIKGWDSLADGRAQFTPHTAFTLPDEDGAPPRESIEVRTIVVIE